LTVNALLGGVLHATVDPSNGDVYYVYGNRDGMTGNNRLSITRLQNNGAGGLTTVSTSFVTGQVQAALPSVAVTNNGTVGVLYDTFDGFSGGFPMFSAHFAVSLDHGLTFSDYTLETFLSSASDNGDPRQRVLGDYQQVKAQGNTFYGVFTGNGTPFGRPISNHDPIFFTFSLPPAYQGFLDGANCSQIAGWAWNQNAPNTPISVDLYDNGNFLANVNANLFRQDLLNAGIGNGSHGFVYNVPVTLQDGLIHSIQARIAGTNINLTGSPRTILCGASLFPTQVPDAVASGAGSTWEQATQFSSSISGKITHIRFYKSSLESGTHIGRIWSDTGTPLTQVTFFGETPSGWQTQKLQTPFPITAGVRYRVSYNINFYVAKTGNGLSSPITNGPLTAYTSFYSTPGGSFPTTGSLSNLFADVVFNSPE
jgi:hypothetical protein